MTKPDYFGILDPVRRLTAPDGFETVHEDGYSWAVSGENYPATSRITAAEWNRIIAQFRGLLAIDGVDLSDMDAASPMILREALLRAIDAALPAAVTAGKAEIAAELEPLLLTAGLPTRLGSLSKIITDWNTATESGFYTSGRKDPDGVTNTPADEDAAFNGNYWHGITMVALAGYVYQEVTSLNGLGVGGLEASFCRWQYGGGWNSWRRIWKSQAGLDSRYAQKGGSADQVFLTSAAAVYGSLSTYGGSISHYAPSPGGGIYEVFRDSTGNPMALMGHDGSTMFYLYNYANGEFLELRNSGGLYYAGNIVRTGGNTPDCTAATIAASDGTNTQQRTVSEAALKTAVEKWAPTDTAAGAIRAWANFNGITTVTVNNSGNVASVVRNGVGDYTVNFTTPLAASTFAVTGTCWNDVNDYIVSVIPIAKTTTSVRILTRSSNHAPYDCDDVSVAVIL